MLDPSGTVFASGLTGPYGLAFDTSGNLYSSNLNNNSISKITPNGSVTPFVNSGLNSPRSLAFDALGNLYCANFNNNNIVKITTNGSVSTFVAFINRPIAINFDRFQKLYCCLYSDSQIIRIETNGSYSLFVNSGLDRPNGLAFDTSGNLYCANYNSNTISQIKPNGNVTTFVNSGLSNPVGLAFDTSGNLYCSNVGDNSISKITPNGSVSTFVDGLNNPRGLAFDTLGNLYCANFGENNIIRFTQQIPPTITNFSVPTKTFGEAPFNIVDPSSNSTGAFSYTSSDPSVCTIFGNTVTIVGAGTSIITATQDASGNYTSGDISANFVVNQSTPTNPVIITNGNDLLYFMNTTSKYGNIINSVQIDNDLLASSEKVLFTTSDNVSITKID
jgi:sugar lactone lactonase YvrE